jgi:hypothetical protein
MNREFHIFSWKAKLLPQTSHVRILKHKIHLKCYRYLKHYI